MPPLRRRGKRRTLRAWSSERAAALLNGQPEHPATIRPAAAKRQRAGFFYYAAASGGRNQFCVGSAVESVSESSCRSKPHVRTSNARSLPTPRARAYTHARAHTHAPARAPANTHARARAQIHTRARARAHTHGSHTKHACAHARATDENTCPSRISWRSWRKEVLIALHCTALHCSNSAPGTS